MKNRASFGICALCEERVSKVAMARHLARCAPSHGARGGRASELFHIRAEGRGAPVFWIDLEIKGESSLRPLDDYLRRVWLECCGHMSAFEIGGLRYSVVVDDEFGIEPNERSMSAKVSDVLTRGQRFGYEYDFGSTTELTLKVLATRSGVIGRRAVRLLARNEPPLWPCAVCSQPANLICPFCVYEGNSLYCAKDARKHACGEEEMFLPVVNSPRMGVCGYTGQV